VRSNQDWELFDIKTDPGQSHNIAARHPDIVKQLKVAYDRWWEHIQPYLVNEDAFKTAPAVNPFKQQYGEQFSPLRSMGVPPMKHGQDARATTSEGWFSKSLKGEKP